MCSASTPRLHRICTASALHLHRICTASAQAREELLRALEPLLRIMRAGHKAEEQLQP
jgi:hypothetical protein